MKRLTNAISPTIFDAYSDSALLLPLVLGNLLSTRLWDLSKKIQKKVAELEQSVDQSTGRKDPLELIRAIQRQINRNFKHLHPTEVISIYGELNIDDERQRLGSEVVNEALSLIETIFTQRMLDGTMPQESVEPLLAQITRNRFPAYYYTNFDVVLANKSLTGHGSGAPLGLTSCLDEVAIFAALAMTMPQETIENVIALTSASHYTAFGWMKSGEAWWFYGKNKLFSKYEWEQFVGDKFNGDKQLAFDAIFKDMDHIVSVAGIYNLSKGISGITDEHTAQIIEKLEQFLGFLPMQVTTGLTRPINRIDESPLAQILRGLLGTQSLEQTQQALRQSTDVVLSQVLYSYRSLDVPQLLPYLNVARHQPCCQSLGQALTSREDALSVIRTISGIDSIFMDRNRIAMPDETLRLKTGTDRDKALLLHVLLEHMLSTQSSDEKISTILTTNDSFVCGKDFCLSLNLLAYTTRPTQDFFGQLSG